MKMECRVRDNRPVWIGYESGDIVGVATSFEDAVAGRFSPFQAASERGKLTTPTRPSKIVCVGMNYTKHAEEMGKALPTEPLLFMKPQSALLAAGDAIVLPPESAEVHHEAELAVVIGKRIKRIGAADVPDAIAGYTLINDVTARDLQRKDGQFTRAKSFDTFAPLGPAIVTCLRPESCYIEARVNGEVRQSSPVSDMVFSVTELVVYISAMMTLEPGDVIATGTPSGVGALHSGDVVEVEIDEIGVLRNTVA